MEFKYSFEKLEVWQESKDLAKSIYLITGGLPDSEKYGIANQMRRAAISVSSNIAEGSSRISKKSKGYFYEVAYGSLMELYSQLIIMKEIGFLSVSTDLEKQIYKISNLLNKLQKSTISKHPGN